MGRPNQQESASSSRYVLDRNAVSALMRGDAAFLERLFTIGRAAVSIPQPVLAEIAFGIERLPRSKRQQRLRRRYELIREEIERSKWSDEVSQAFGRIKAGLERRGALVEDLDIAIAAHAVATGAVLVSTNLSHMARIPGLEVEDWTRVG